MPIVRAETLTTNFGAWYACPIAPSGGRSGQGFSLYHDKECESHLTIAHVHGPDRALGLCANPRSKGSNPASKQKVVHVRRRGAVLARLR